MILAFPIMEKIIAARLHDLKTKIACKLYKNARIGDAVASTEPIYIPGKLCCHIWVRVVPLSLMVQSVTFYGN